MNDIVIIGAGGLGQEIASLIEDINKNEASWNLLGYVDDDLSKLGVIENEYEVLGTTSWLYDKSIFIINAIANGEIRERINNFISNTNNKFATLIHPSVIVTSSVQIGEGSILCAGSILTTNIAVGRQVIINYSSTIGHDALLEDYITILPGVNISGYVKAKKGSTFGTGSQVIQGITIGENTIVGAGATVVKDLPANCTAVGVPAKPIKFFG